MKTPLLLSIAALTALTSYQPAEAAVVPSRVKRHLFPAPTPIQDYRTPRVIRDNKYNVFTLLSRLPSGLRAYVGRFMDTGHDCDNPIGLPGSMHRSLKTINNHPIRQIHFDPRSSIIVCEGFNGDFHFYDTNTGEKARTFINPNFIRLPESPLTITFKKLEERSLEEHSAGKLYTWNNSPQMAITIEGGIQNEREVYTHLESRPMDPKMHITDHLICCYPTFSQGINHHAANPKRLAALAAVRQRIQKSEDLEISIGQEDSTLWDKVDPATKAHLLKKGLAKVSRQIVLKGTGTPTILKGKEKRGTKRRIRPMGENPFSRP